MNPGVNKITINGSGSCTLCGKQLSGSLTLELRGEGDYKNMVAHRTEDPNDLIATFVGHHYDYKEWGNPHNQHNVFTIDGIGIVETPLVVLEPYIHLFEDKDAELLFEQLISGSVERLK